MLLGILQQRAGLFVANRDVYASVAGGVRVSEPAADLAIAFAIASAACDIGPVPGTVVTGEIGLAGEVRQVPSIARRLAEAARLGFTRAIVPEGTPPVDGIELFPVATLAAALHTTFGTVTLPAATRRPARAATPSTPPAAPSVPGVDGETAANGPDGHESGEPGHPDDGAGAPDVVVDLRRRRHVEVS